MATLEARIQRALAHEVRELRQSLDLSQEALGLACGLDRTYLGGVERGERNISVVNLCKVARVLHVPAGELLPSLSAERGRK